MRTVSGRKAFVPAWMVHSIDLNVMVTMGQHGRPYFQNLHMLSSNTYEALLGGGYHVRAAPLFDEFSTLALMTSTYHLAWTSTFGIVHDLQELGFPTHKKSCYVRPLGWP